ncbi:hypothetical protein ACJJI3_03360 [Microbulbifer sp. ZKSA004]|uniref:hypothetical protein n=1 Tax=Microbulbifer sp. ZKSA004 TaxID=3243389 RepID=UPI00403A7624
MLSAKSKDVLNFHGGISGVSYLEQQPTTRDLPSAKRIIYYNNNTSPSHLSELFKRSNGQQLLNKVCVPDRSDIQPSACYEGEKKALYALEWIRGLDCNLTAEIREKSEQIFMELAELELKDQVQRNLLCKV